MSSLKHSESHKIKKETNLKFYFSFRFCHIFFSTLLQPRVFTRRVSIACGWDSIDRTSRYVAPVLAMATMETKWKLGRAIFTLKSAGAEKQNHSEINKLGYRIEKHKKFRKTMIMKRLVDGASTGGAWGSTPTSRAFNIVHGGSQWGFTLDVGRLIFSNYDGWRLNFRAFDGWWLLTRKSVQEIKKYRFLYKIMLTWCLGGHGLGLSL